MLTSESGAAGLGRVSRETADKLRAFEALVEKWTRHIGLVSVREATSSIWQRHIVDSAQLFQQAPPSFLTWADIGSGGGFPGLVIAIMAAELNPDARITLIESDQRKAAFLVAAATELGVEARVIPMRSEIAPPRNADVISARAFAPLDRLLAHVLRHLASDGIAILPKGRSVNQELAEAKMHWQFSTELVPSITNPASSIVKIRDLQRV